MSILVESGITAPLHVEDFFPTSSAHPMTICAFMRVVADGMPPAFLSISPVAIGDHDTDGHRIGFYEDTGGDTRGAQVRSCSSACVSARANMLPNDPAGKWIPVIGVFSGFSDRVAWSKMDGQIFSGQSTSSATFGSATDLRLFHEAWDYGDIQLAHIAIYDIAFSESQVAEFLDNATTTGLTPYAQWDATEDWSGGDILDISGNGRHITPPAAWAFSSDNPPLGPQISAIPDSVTPTEEFTITVSGDISDATGYGLSSVTIGGVAQTIISNVYDSEAFSTVVTLSAVRENLTYADNYDVILTLDDASTVEASISLAPAANWKTVTTLNPSTELGSFFYDHEGGAPVDGMQVHYDGEFVTLGADGIPTEITSETMPIDVDAEVWRPGSGTWSAMSTVTLYDAESGEPEPEPEPGPIAGGFTRRNLTSRAMTSRAMTRRSMTS